MRIAINGAGIAGPTLAYWLNKSGHQVLLVEEAREPRKGGYIIDFWGIGYDIAEKMGIMPRLLDLGYQVGEVRLVGDDGKRVGGFGTDVFGRATGGRFTSLLRSDLAATIVDALNDEVETIYGDSIASIDEDSGCVRVGFEHAASREFDLVVGADGLHSRVRSLAFGPESTFEVPLDYHVAAFAVEGYKPRDELVYVSHAVPGRQISRFTMRGNKTLFLCVFHDDYLPAHPETIRNGGKSIVREVFADVGWEAPAMIAAVDEVDEVYFDSVSQIRMDRWTKGRTALVGDAAACVSLLAGEGTGLAMAEAYVLAGELATCDGDYEAGLRRYEQRMGPFLKQKQGTAAKFASSFAPRTRVGIAFRILISNLLRIPIVADYFLTRNLRDDIDLPDYRFSAVNWNGSHLR